MSYIGFTGSRTGMTDAQKVTMARLLAELRPKQVHHGDAIGSDADFHALARATSAVVVVHPPEDEKDRAFCTGDRTLPALPYLERNKAIVNACTVLIATPDSEKEQVRSGTWSTIRYAAREKKIMRVVMPNGEVLSDYILRSKN